MKAPTAASAHEAAGFCSRCYRWVLPWDEPHNSPEWPHDHAADLMRVSDCQRIEARIVKTWTRRLAQARARTPV